MISIITPTYNSANFIQETLNSISEQTFRDFEVIIIDNCSDDGTINIVKEHELYLSNIIKVHYNEIKNVSISRNIGIENASGEFLLFLDSDDLLKPGALQILTNNIKNHDLVIGAWEDFSNNTGAVISTSLYEINEYDTSAEIYLRYKPVISAALIKKDAALKWDIQMKVWEVTAFFFDSILNHSKTIFINDVVTSIRQHDSTSRLSIKHKHFDAINTASFLINCRRKVTSASSPNLSIEALIDQEIIDCCYTAIRNGGDPSIVKTNIACINHDLIGQYNHYKFGSLYYFVNLFNGYKGLYLFYILNRFLGRI